MVYMDELISINGIYCRIAHGRIRVFASVFGISKFIEELFVISP
jgi:hypothetical protein